MRLCVLHNLYFYNHLMEDIRAALDEGRYKKFKEEALDAMKEFDKDEPIERYDIAKGWKKG